MLKLIVLGGIGLGFLIWMLLPEGSSSRKSFSSTRKSKSLWRKLKDACCDEE